MYSRSSKMVETGSRYLKEASHYEGLYDRLTVQLCHAERDNMVCAAADTLVKHRLNPANAQRASSILQSLTPCMVAYDRWKGRRAGISQFMADDRAKDDLVANTVPPMCDCPRCPGSLSVIDKAVMKRSDDDANDQVLFMFECRTCQKRQARWPDGEDLTAPPLTCESCGQEAKREYNESERGVMIRTSCLTCSWSESETLAPRVDTDDRELEADIERWCLSDEQGRSMESTLAYAKRAGEQDALRVAAVQVAKLRKLRVNELSAWLLPALTEHGFGNFEVGSPLIDRHVVVQFSVQETTARNDGKGCSDLSRLLKSLLEDTNWRLMSDGVSAQLGLLYGRMKGYDSDEDLRNLAARRSDRLS